MGDLITVEKKRNNGWWIGSLSNGKRGYFPTNYVELLLPDSNPDADDLRQSGEETLRRHQHLPESSKGLTLSKRQSSNDDKGSRFNPGFS